MAIKVKCFASMREYLDLGERETVNQTQASAAYAVKDGDEVAFFPPVTGG